MNSKVRQALAQTTTRIAQRRSDEVNGLLGQLAGLAADDHLDLAWKDQERARLRRAVDACNDAARAELAKVLEPLVKSARTRQATGTPLESSALAEAQLLVTQYGGRTEIEQRQLATDAAEALTSGALDRARVLHRAAVALGVAEDATGHALDQADPVKKAAADDLASVAALIEAVDSQASIELGDAGIGGTRGAIVAELARHAGDHQGAIQAAAEAIARS